MTAGLTGGLYIAATGMLYSDSWCVLTHRFPCTCLIPPPLPLSHACLFSTGTGKGTSVLEMVKTFEEATGQKVPYKVGGAWGSSGPCVPLGALAVSLGVSCNIRGRGDLHCECWVCLLVKAHCPPSVGNVLPPGGTPSSHSGGPLQCP
jgi:hypothetical protein